VTRRVRLPDGSQVLLTDTVGFIQKLPTSLVASFRATLEEMQAATVLLHVLDISHPNAPEHVDVVTQILDELGLTNKPRVLALNKADLLDPDVDTSFLASVSGATAVLTSVNTGVGLDELLQVILEVVEPLLIDPAAQAAAAN
jgi:GTP-binding protein HflX